MLGLVLLHNKINSARTDKHKGQEQDPNHGILDLIFKIPDQCGPQSRRRNYQEAHREKDEIEAKNISEGDQFICKSYNRSTYYHCIVFINIQDTVIISIDPGPLKS